MPSRTKNFPIRLERLESRDLPATLPVNTLAVATGDVAAPGASAAVSTPVTAHNINGKASIVIGFSITPAAGSALMPRVVAAYGADGARLPIQRGAPFIPGVHDSVTLFVTVSQPGQVTVVVAGTRRTTGAFQAREYLPGDVNGDGQVTIADYAAFAPSFLSTVGQPYYNVAADANLNGQIGIGDAKYIVRNLTPLTPPTVPLYVSFYLPYGQEARLPHTTNEGGVSYLQNLTIIGHTIPGSLVIADSGLGDYSFNRADDGHIVPTDANGMFVDRVKQVAGSNNFDYLIIDPYGRQIIQDFPTVWTKFAEPNSPIHRG